MYRLLIKHKFLLIFMFLTLGSIASILFLAFIWKLWPTEISLVTPTKDSFESVEPVQRVEFWCTNVSKIFINDKELEYSQKEAICGTDGYNISLIDGENIFKFKAVDDSGKKESNIDLKIIFDQKSYDERIAKEETDRKQREAEQARLQAEATAKAAADREAKLKKYATDYCSKRKTSSMRYGKLSVSNTVINFDFAKGKTGRYMTYNDCRAMTDALVKYMESEKGQISEYDMQIIISGDYYIGMDEYFFLASVGNPDDINTTETSTNKRDQIVYHKDYYGISAEYFYFDNRTLTSHQDF